MDSSSFENDNADLDDSDQSVSDNEIVLNDDELWDDTLLIQMYENSQQEINDALIKRFTTETLPCKEEQSVKNKSKPKNKEKNKKNSKSTAKTAGSKKTNLEHKWLVGDYCRLVFLENDVEYEAKIICIDDSSSTCLIQYIGYENEEVRNLSDLKPSAGDFVRKMQIKMAIQDGYGKTNTEQPTEENNSINSSSANTQKHQNGTPSVKQEPIAGTSKIIPPPPFLADSSSNANDDDDVLASMLMSWYMTGYHTGYYQALKDSKKQQNT